LRRRIALAKDREVRANKSLARLQAEIASVNSRKRRLPSQGKWACYKWHLRPLLPVPFKVILFDSLHWWKQSADVEPVAALYELARRHPSVGLRMTQPWILKNPTSALIVLGDIGLSSWPKLTSGQKALWKTFAGNLKGVDSRNDDEKCFDIEWQDENNRMAEFKRGAGIPSVADIKAGIARRAVEAYQQGFVLLAVAPGLAQDEAAALLSQKYHEHLLVSRAVRGAGKQRSRHGNWLDLISAFERAAATNAKDMAQVFARYRRAMDGVRF